MFQISSVRLAIPKAAAGEIKRQKLVDTILGNQKKITFIHAGAGFGKTTLLSQVANCLENTVWITLDNESDVFAFLNILSEALRNTFSCFDFNSSAYLPFEEKSNFINILANAILSRIEQLKQDFTIILDDLHTIEDPQIKKLIACILKYRPEHIRLCLSSRELPWPELIPLRVRGHILEVSQAKLAFTRSEALQLLGFDDQYIYLLTEGWPLAMTSFKILLENGVSIADVPSHRNEALYSYLFYECISRLSPEIVDFLKNSACFEELDPSMLDTILATKNTRLLLESLATRNIFTSKTDGEHYRYHPLFRKYLLECAETGQTIALQSRAAQYYLKKQQYAKAAEYAMRLENKELLEQIILLSYKDKLKNGDFSELRLWFTSLKDPDTVLSRELLVAKGAFLSSIGNFTEAQLCLDMAIPLLDQDNTELYVEAMAHKARVLRNFISFEESNKLLDKVIAQLTDQVSELSYSVIIEKIYNLGWNSQIEAAYALTYHMIEACAKAGHVKVKAWYERYLSVLHFLAGRMKDAVYYYEKSLALPETEREYLDMHSVEIYIAKAYQMLGERDKAVAMITAELQKLQSAGRYEELWLGYLFAAEIHYQNTSIDRFNGGNQTFETTLNYFALADEYAPLYRKAAFQVDWAKLQRNTYSLMFANGPKEHIISEIFDNVHKVGDYFKTIVLGRLFSYFGTIGDFPNAVKCARMSIEIGERANVMLIPSMAYGFLSRVSLANKDLNESTRLVKRFLLLCQENGIYEYFRMRKAYDPILEFALANGIEPEITKQLMVFAGYKRKKIYIATLGDFAVYPYDDRETPVKLRTRKERELLAFLLDAGAQGVTKEQIYRALWYESESDDIKKLIGVNLAQIKKDLSRLGVSDPIVNHSKHYRIDRDEIVVDTELFEAAAQQFERQNSKENAQKLLSLYKGEYLADFAALWAIDKRIHYAAIFNAALSFLKRSE